MHQFHPFKALLNTGQDGFWRSFATFWLEGLGTAPWVDLGGGVKGEIQLFQNIVMLHTKLKGNMVANNLPANTLDCGGGVKPFFLKVVMLHINLKGMERRAPCKHVVCPYTKPWPMGSNWR